MGKSVRGFLAVLLTTLGAVGAFVIYSAATASAQGRTIDGNFCMPTVNGVMQMFCIETSFGGQDLQGYTNHPETLTLDPGTYWLNLHDDSTGHDFALRSCPGATTACVAGVGVPVQSYTTKLGVTDVTAKLLLKAGTYRLFCDVGNNNDFTTAGFHESHGMYVDINVVGTD